jgi:PERQ amino acid-rich with GYF domain-containing protein
MLLSFPLDPDPSTVELISDLVYANSTTLDGRRFASEYIAKRKSDATSARSGTRSATTTIAKTPAAPTSMAEIARQQPKTQAAGNEWGGFKVVNKKKKSKA